MLGKCLRLPGSLTSWLLNEVNALNTLSWLRLCSHARRTGRSVSQKVAGWQRIGQQHLLGQSRYLQYVCDEWKRLCGRHIPYAVNAYRGEYMMRYSWAEITTASLLQFPWRYKKRTFSEQFFCCCTRGTIILWTWFIKLKWTEYHIMRFQQKITLNLRKNQKDISREKIYILSNSQGIISINRAGTLSNHAFANR